MPISTRNLKALILVGGTGTRLQPITFTTPKPLVPFVNRPMLEHQVEALARAGVEEIVLAMNYKYKRIIEAVDGFSGRYGIKITYSLEKEPLGTAGPIALACEYLSGSTFFVLNADVICEFPLDDLLDFHRRTACLGTILATTVESPEKFGVIKTRKGSALVEAFVEKPAAYVGNRVNAGIYVFESSVLQYFECRPSSVENEVFPRLAAMQQLCVYDLRGFWMDIGTLEGYLKAQQLYLKNTQSPCARLGEDVVIGPQAVIGRYVTLGRGVSVGRAARLENCTVFENTKIGDHVQIRNSVVGRECCVEGDVSIDCSIVGDKSRVRANAEGSP